jgi:outer membrane autotransporter protein
MSNVINGNVNLNGTVDIKNGDLNVSGDLDFGSDSVVQMNIAENKIVASKITMDANTTIQLSAIPTGTINNANVIVSNTAALNTNVLDQLFTINKLLVTLRPFYTNSNQNMGLESSLETAEHYAVNNNFRHNQIQIAGLLDDYSGIQQQLQSLSTRSEFEGLIKIMLAPELAADARGLPLNNPYFRVFNHINNLPASFANNNLRNNNSNTLIRGQSACLPAGINCDNTKHEFWFEGYYQGGKIDGDSNALGYKTTRGGMMIGVDQYFGDGLLTELIFGYGNPRAYNSTGKIEADDYTFGVYSRLKIFGIYANTFLGYGSQNYQLRQIQNQHTKFNGDSMYASLELFKPIYLRNNISVSPLVAIDFQKAWSDGFNINTIVPLTIKKGEMDQTILRLGANSNYKNWRTRLHSCQLAGDLHGVSRTSITGGGNNNRILSGVNLGRHTFNAGFGGDFQINNRTKLFADYDLDLGKHATAHTGQFGFVRYF